MNRRAFLSTAAASLASVASLAQNNPSDPVRYPDPRVEVLDPRFQKHVVGNAAIERLHTGMRWAEGPVWFGDGRYLLWSDIPNNCIMRWTEETGAVSVFRSPSHFSNGNTRDQHGRLITCERRRVTRTELDGRITVLMDNFEDKPLNCPNDAAVHPDGHIWFTDPGYGISGFYEGAPAPFELPTSIYRLNPDTGEATRVTDEPERPNGIAFSPDYTKLYVSDTGASHKDGHPKHIRVYDVIDGARLGNGEKFCDMGRGFADGLRVDIHGNVWTSAGWVGSNYDGVHIYAPDGDLIGKIRLPEICANLCFGGVNRNRLFMAASQSLYSLYVETQGMQVW